MIISIASGKGGTGKTTIAINLALSLKDVQYMDCDVEEPNGHLFLKPLIEERISVGIPVPQVDESRCTYCGKCAEICEFNAIVVIKKKVLLFPELCHGCGGCSYLCPEDAIEEV
ncbi:MAG: (4Fe-4S)-binding protein, partial [Deltaproteobacteria bacterium CG06_land_8_20_14_3_00_44_19]